MILVLCLYKDLECVYMCLCMYTSICQRYFTKWLAPERRGEEVDSVHCCSRGRSNQVAASGFRANSKQLTCLKALPYFALHCTLCLFWSGANVCAAALVISDGKIQRATPQMKLSKWHDSGVSRQTFCFRTFYSDRSETSQGERKSENEREKIIIILS